MVTDVSNGKHRHAAEQPYGGSALVSVPDRTGKLVVALLFLATGVTAAAAAAVVPVLIAGESGQALPQMEGAVLAGLVAGTAALLWFAVSLCLLRPNERLAADVRLLATPATPLNTTAFNRVDPDDYPDLAPLPEAVNALIDRITATQRELDRTVANSAESLAEQRDRLISILRNLEEGVLVCNLHHQVLLHNPAALHLLQASGVVNGDLEPGRALFSLMLPDPIRHTLERLNRHGGGESRQPGASARFIGGTPDGRILLDGRMSLILGDGVRSTASGSTVTGYVLTFTDATRELEALGRRDALLHATTEELRAPLANLRAVMETLRDCPDLDGEARVHLEAAMLRECENLTTRLERITEQYRATVAGTWPMSDLRSHTLIDLVRHRLAQRQMTITPTGVPCLLYGDSFSLVVLLDHLVERVSSVTGVTDFDLAAAAAARWTYLDLFWNGEPIPSTTIGRWKTEPLAAALGGLTVGDVLRHHRSDLWSEAQPEGRARLRLPLPPAQEPTETGPPPKSSQIEPGAFSALRQPTPAPDLTARRLHDLDFVVFDIEATGLNPIDGDEIVAIAAVRVANRRILTDDTFQALVNPSQALVNPGRPISPEAVRYHSIDEQHVHAPPDITAVLPKFKAFVGNAVLVGHYAGLELAFLRLRERACGVRFDNPVLDTKLLSLWLQGLDADHSLDGIARRLGIATVDRHTTLGDCLTTAAVLVAMLDPLRDRGLVTLGDVLREADLLVTRHAKETLP